MQPHIVLKPVAEVYGTTISNTITSLPNIPSNALRAQVQCETADVRYRLDGAGSVTGGVGGGMLLLSGTELEIEGWDNMNRAQFYRDGTSDGVINVIYFGEGQP